MNNSPDTSRTGTSAVPRDPFARREAVIRSLPKPGVARTVDPDQVVPTPSIAKAHLAYGDVIRIVGIAAVVIGHVCSDIVYNLPMKREVPPVSTAQWWYALSIDSFSRFAVPLFVMLSGALLLKRGSSSQTPIDFYKRRLSRIGVPAIFWALAFFALVVRHDVMAGQIPENGLRRLASGEPAAHLHFLFRIAGLYLFTPFIRAFIDAVSRQTVIRTTALCLLIAGLDAMLRPWLRTVVLDGNIGSASGSFAAMFVPFLGYFLLGHVMSSMRFSRAHQMLMILAMLASVAGIVLGTGYLHAHFGYTSPDDLRSTYFLDLLNPLRIVIAFCAFGLVRTWFDHPWPASRFWGFVSSTLAPATLGVYLVHPLFQGVFEKLRLDPRTVGVWIGVPLNATLVIVASFVFTLVMMRLPLLNWIVGARIERKARPAD